MKGSEKQVKWAEEIRANVVKTIEQAIKMLTPYLADEAKKAQAENAINTYRAWLAALNSAEYAATIIDLFKHIQFTGNFNSDFKAVQVQYIPSVRKAFTDDEGRVLCR